MNNNKTAFWALAFIMVLGGLALAGAGGQTVAVTGPDLRLRFFEGIRPGAREPARVITSSFLHSTITANIESEEDLAEEQKQIKKTFNLDDVKLLTEAVLKFPAGRSEKISHLLRLDGKQYSILITPADRARMKQFRVEIFELSNEKKMSLLDTEVILPARNIAVFGFEDTQQKPYFLALRVARAGGAGGVEGAALGGVEGGVEGGVIGGVEGGVEGGVIGGVEGGVVGGGAGSTRAEFVPPKLIKKVEPLYPVKARLDRVEGVVDAEATTDTQGRVQTVKILRSVPKLDQAVVDAVKQWVYKPALVNGKPVPVSLKISCRFTLRGGRHNVEESSVVVAPPEATGISGKEKGEQGKVTQAAQEFAKGAVKITGDMKPPQLIKKVDPVYPEIARQSHVEGVVILAVRTDTSGKVKDVMVLRSIPLLDQAAIDAVRQWVYKPLIVEGKPVEAVFTVTVRFSLDGKKSAKSAQAIEQFAKGAVKITGDMNPPQLTTKVDPVYPEIARQSRVEGVVILEVRTDTTGKVKDVMVLRSIPLLDQAAIDAVRQWVYKPLIVEGKPVEAVFTVTVRFELKGGEKEEAAEAEKAGETEKGAVRATGEINPPRLLKKVEPVYPQEARKAGVEGTVILEAMTDARGNVAGIKVLKSIPELDQAAIDALKQWKYEPTIIDGKPTPVVFTVTIRFRLQ
jgi:TonB family protein